MKDKGGGESVKSADARVPGRGAGARIRPDDLDPGCKCTAKLIVYRNEQGQLRLAPDIPETAALPGETETMRLDLDEADAAAFLAGWATGDAREAGAQAQWAQWQAERVSVLEDKGDEGAA